MCSTAATTWSLDSRDLSDSGGDARLRTTGTQADFGDPTSTGHDSSSANTAVVDVGLFTEPSTRPAQPVRVAIYADDRRTRTLVCAQLSGELRGNTWNTVPFSTWCLHHARRTGSSTATVARDAVNNLTFSPVVAEPLDSVIRAAVSGSQPRGACRQPAFGSPAATACVAVALRSGCDVELASHHLWAGFVAGLLLELVLKQTLFVPYSTYIRGHALRAVFIPMVHAAHRASLASSPPVTRWRSSWKCVGGASNRLLRRSAHAQVAGWSLASGGTGSRQS